MLRRAFTRFAAANVAQPTTSNHSSNTQPVREGKQADGGPAIWLRLLTATPPATASEQAAFLGDVAQIRVPSHPDVTADSTLQLLERLDAWPNSDAKEVVALKRLAIEWLAKVAHKLEHPQRIKLLIACLRTPPVKWAVDIVYRVGVTLIATLSCGEAVEVFAGLPDDPMDPRCVFIGSLLPVRVLGLHATAPKTVDSAALVCMVSLKSMDHWKPEERLEVRLVKLLLAEWGPSVATKPTSYIPACKCRAALYERLLTLLPPFCGDETPAATVMDAFVELVTASIVQGGPSAIPTHAEVLDWLDALARTPLSIGTTKLTEAVLDAADALCSTSAPRDLFGLGSSLSSMGLPKAAELLVKIKDRLRQEPQAPPLDVKPQTMTFLNSDPGFCVDLLMKQQPCVTLGKMEAMNMLRIAIAAKGCEQLQASQRAHIDAIGKTALLFVIEENTAKSFRSIAAVLNGLKTFGVPSDTARTKALQQAADVIKRKTQSVTDFVEVALVASDERAILTLLTLALSEFPTASDRLVAVRCIIKIFKQNCHESCSTRLASAVFSCWSDPTNTATDSQLCDILDTILAISDSPSAILNFLQQKNTASPIPTLTEYLKQKTPQKPAPTPQETNDLKVPAANSGQPVAPVTTSTTTTEKASESKAVDLIPEKVVELASEAKPSENAELMLMLKSTADVSIEERDAQLAKILERFIEIQSKSELIALMTALVALNKKVWISSQGSLGSSSIRDLALGFSAEALAALWEQVGSALALFNKGSPVVHGLANAITTKDEVLTLLTPARILDLLNVLQQEATRTADAQTTTTVPPSTDVASTVGTGSTDVAPLDASEHEDVAPTADVAEGNSTAADAVTADVPEVPAAIVEPAAAEVDSKFIDRVLAVLDTKQSAISGRACLARLVGIPARVADKVFRVILPTISFNDLDSAVFVILASTNPLPCDVTLQLAHRIEVLTAQYNSEELVPLVQACARVSQVKTPSLDPVATKAAFTRLVEKLLRLDTIIDAASLNKFINGQKVTVMRQITDNLCLRIQSISAGFTLEDCLKIVENAGKRELLTGALADELWKVSFARVKAATPLSTASSDTDHPLVRLARGFADADAYTAERALQVVALLDSSCKREMCDRATMILVPDEDKTPLEKWNSTIGLCPSLAKRLNALRWQSGVALSGEASSITMPSLSSIASLLSVHGHHSLPGVAELAVIFTKISQRNKDSEGGSSARPTATDSEWSRVLLTLSKADEWPSITVAAISELFSTQLDRYDGHTLVVNFRAIATSEALSKAFAEPLLNRLQTVIGRLDADDLCSAMSGLLELKKVHLADATTTELLSELIVSRFIAIHEKDHQALKRIHMVRLLEYLGALESDDLEAIAFVVRLVKANLKHFDGKQASAILQGLAKLPWREDGPFLGDLVAAIGSDATPAVCAHAVCAAASFPLRFSTTIERMFVRVLMNRDVFIHNPDLRSQLQVAATVYHQRLPTQVYHAFVKKAPRRWQDFPL